VCHEWRFGSESSLSLLDAISTSSSSASNLGSTGYAASLQPPVVLPKGIVQSKCYRASALRVVVEMGCPP